MISETEEGIAAYLYHSAQVHPPRMVTLLALKAGKPCLGVKALN